MLEERSEEDFMAINFLNDEWSAEGGNSKGRLY